MSLSSNAFKKKAQDIESFIATRKDAIAFLDEIVNTDIAQVHKKVNKFKAISRKELGFLIGLLLKQKNLSQYLSPLDAQYNKDIKILRTKLENLHYEIFRRQNGKIVDKNEEYFTSESLVETTFYEESGFYNDQPLILSKYLYKNSEQWIFKNKGFKLESLTHFYFATCKVLERKRLEYFQSGKHYDINNVFFSPEEIVNEGISILGKNAKLTKRETINIIKSFSCKAGSQLPSFHRPGDENYLTYCPIIEIDEKHFWLPLPDMLAIAIYLSPLHWMREDTNYKNIANQNIGIALEDICDEIISRVFDKHYKTVKIYKGKDTYTDIDSLAIIGNTAIILQAKNKRMTPNTFAGDINSLKHDFSIVVQEAYNQGVRSSEAIKQKNIYTFRDRNGKKIIIPNINKTIILCISSGVYYAGAIQVNEYLKQKHPDAQLPVLLSAFDLDLLTRYITNPYELIFYLELRINQYKNITSNNEIAPLSAYLFSDILHNNNSNYTLLTDDIISCLDEDYYENQSYRNPKPSKHYSMRFKNAPYFTNLLANLEKSKQKEKDIIIRKLLSLAIDEAIHLSDKLQQQSLSVLNNKQPEFSILFTDFGFSYLEESNDTLPNLLQRIKKSYNGFPWIIILQNNTNRIDNFIYLDN
ncbi:hypothetical protein IKG28_01270 [Candidatus Saccharibacteria bacterium]|nr:hypothetical protein [Candidatus Saccharibacteria bacterium]